MLYGDAGCYSATPIPYHTRTTGTCLFTIATYPYSHVHPALECLIPNQRPHDQPVLLREQPLSCSRFHSAILCHVDSGLFVIESCEYYVDVWDAEISMSRGGLADCGCQHG